MTSGSAPPGLDADANGTGSLCGWGKVARPGRQEFAEDLESASKGAVLFRGLGRSYGDASLPPPSRPIAIATPRADRLLAFDAETGRVRAEAGIALRELNRLFLPRGWFVPVTPGTQHVTLGGMVAADVHGKNHHVDGCFGRHVTSLRVRTGEGRLLECSRETERELFLATLGGMGLTGHVLDAEFVMKRVPSPWIVRETVRVPDVGGFVDALQSAASRWPYTVGWIDCLSRGSDLGRGVLIAGRFAEPHEAPSHAPKPRRIVDVPFDLPGFVLRGTTVRAFNALYFGAHRTNWERSVIGAERFFYPLDAVGEWNRMYGRRGFTQYQCVLPARGARDGARRLLDRLTSRGGASFLCVIKDCGPEGDGLLSFPMRGTSIAVDIPLRDDTQALVDALNELVLAEGGRVYLAKDLLTRPEHFRAMEPRLGAFQEARRCYDPRLTIRSALSVRLFGDPA